MLGDLLWIIYCAVCASMFDSSVEGVRGERADGAGHQPERKSNNETEECDGDPDRAVSYH